MSISTYFPDPIQGLHGSDSIFYDGLGYFIILSGQSFCPSPQILRWWIRKAINIFNIVVFKSSNNTFQVRFFLTAMSTLLIILISNRRLGKRLRNSSLLILMGICYVGLPCGIPLRGFVPNDCWYIFMVRCTLSFCSDSSSSLPDRNCFGESIRHRLL